MKSLYLTQFLPGKLTVYSRGYDVNSTCVALVVKAVDKIKIKFFSNPSE
jgi:hypothetical protein